MDIIELRVRNGDAVRQAIELGDLVYLDTASQVGYADASVPCETHETLRCFLTRYQCAGV